MSSLSHESLHLIRAAFVLRVDTAVTRTLRHREPAGMPYALQDVGAFLVAAGLTADPCAGERGFGMDEAAYRALAGHPETVASGEILAIRMLEAVRGGTTGASAFLPAMSAAAPAACLHSL
jgi:hypothetical protein